MLHGAASAELGRGKRQALEVARPRQAPAPQQHLQQLPIVHSEGMTVGDLHAEALPTQAPVVVSLSAHAGRDAPADPMDTPFSGVSHEQQQEAGTPPRWQQQQPGAGGGAAAGSDVAGLAGQNRRAAADGRCAVSRVRGGALVPLEAGAQVAAAGGKADAAQAPDQAAHQQPRGKDPKVVSQLAQDLAGLRAAASESQAAAGDARAKGRVEAQPKRTTQTSWLAGLPHITTVRRMGRPAERGGA